MSAIEDRERTVLIDISRAVNSADAVRQLELYLEQSRTVLGPGAGIDLNTGDLLLTPGILAKIKAVLSRFGVKAQTLYSDVPQTQQSALDEGLSVRRYPPSKKGFDPNQFMASAYKDLDLPFESLSRPVIQPPVEKQGAPVSRPAPVSRLSVTHDDGTLEELFVEKNLPLETLFYKQTLRSGQVLESSGNIVVVGDAHSGSEILADGDILVWGFLGGIAHAGRNGNDRAEIRAVRIEAVQLRIGSHIARRPDRLFNNRAKKRTPEVAKVKNGEIQIYEDIVE